MRKVDFVIYVLLLVFAFGYSTVYAQGGEIKLEIKRIAKVKANEFVSQFKTSYSQSDEVGDWLEEEFRDWVTGDERRAQAIAEFDAHFGRLAAWILFREIFTCETERNR